MAFAADHQHRFHGLLGLLQAPVHAKTLGQLAQLGVQLLGGQVAGKAHAHEKKAGGVFVLVVGVLRGVQDVAASLKQKAGDGVDDARAVRAGKLEDV